MIKFPPLIKSPPPTKGFYKEDKFPMTSVELVEAIRVLYTLMSSTEFFYFSRNNPKTKEAVESNLISLLDIQKKRAELIW
jgi:hypothetical protein